jgi:hypothetical protein
METTIKILELSKREITGSSNGYPETRLGDFFFGFDNLDQAKEYADQVGGEVRIASWKDGWANCTLQGTPYEEFTPSDDDYGDDFHIIDSAEELEDAAFGMIEESMDDEEKQAWKESGDDLIACCADINWEKDSVLLHCGDFYETVAKKSMVFHYDTKTSVIGVVVFS